MELRRIIQSMREPRAYPHPAGDLRVHHTHISVVFLAGDFAYKVKKPVDLGFLDFTTLEQRLRYCRQEVRLNQRLAPDVYLGVVPLVPEDGGVGVADGRERAEDGPEPVEYAVKMKRLPPDAVLGARLERDEADASDVRLVARRIAAFHREAEGGPEIARYGRWEVVAGNARENFEQAEEHVGETLSEPVYEKLAALNEAELDRLRPLVERRAREGRPRDTHGDLHLEHVYLFPDREPPDDLVVVDCIEFNDRFRYADPVSDAAFLFMDLKSHGRRDLADAFADAYFEAADDPEGRRLLGFYSAYRAAVRGKVEGFKALDPEVPEEERSEAAETARAHWLLALCELARPEERPGLVLVGGLPGTGKSTLARGLSARSGFRRISSDRTRKELAGIDPGEPAGAGFEEGIYAPEWTERTYEELLERTDEELLEGGRVVVDASFRQEAHRLAFLRLARKRNVPFRLLLCRAPRDTVRRRLRDRASGGAATEGASDADWVVYTEAEERWEEPGPEMRQRVREVSTGAPPSESLEQALEALREAGLAGSEPA